MTVALGLWLKPFKPLELQIVTGRDWLDEKSLTNQENGTELKYCKPIYYAIYINLQK